MLHEQKQAGATYSKVFDRPALVMLLMAVVYALIELREFYPRGSEIRETFKAWHFTMGLLVFGLVWIRLVARLRTSRPPQPRSAADWLAVAMHLALYVLMVLMPVIGWMVLSASGKPIPFFAIDLPALIPKNKALGEQLKEVHELVGVAGYWLVGLHASAALFHHYLLKDGTLRRMLPTANT